MIPKFQNFNAVNRSKIIVKIGFDFVCKAVFPFSTTCEILKHFRILRYRRNNLNLKKASKKVPPQGNHQYFEASSVKIGAILLPENVITAKKKNIIVIHTFSSLRSESKKKNPCNPH